MITEEVYKKGMEETYELLGRNTSEAHHQGAIEAEIFIMKNKDLILDLMMEINDNKFEQVLYICDKKIEEIKSTIANYPPSQTSLNFLLANIYILKGTCMGEIAFYRKQKNLGEQGLKIMEQGIRMTEFPPNARRMALNAYESVAKNMGVSIPKELANDNQENLSGIKRKICPECKGTGKIGSFFSKSTCGICKGKGDIINPDFLSHEEKMRTGIHYYENGMSLNKEGKHKEAIELINFALMYDPSLFEAHEKRITIAYNAENYDDARKYADVIVKAFPSNGDTHYLKSHVYFTIAMNSTNLHDRLSNLRTAHQEIKLALDYQCQIQNARELYYSIQEKLRASEISDLTSYRPY